VRSTAQQRSNRCGARSHDCVDVGDEDFRVPDIGCSDIDRVRDPTLTLDILYRFCNFKRRRRHRHLALRRQFPGCASSSFGHPGPRRLSVPE